MSALSMVCLHLLLLLTCALASAPDRSFPSPGRYEDALDEDALSQHMRRLYEKYRRENRLKEGNTVRSVRAKQESTDPRLMYRLNLTTLQDSEVILSATFHYLVEKHLHSNSWFCKRPLCRYAAIHPPPSISLLIRSVPSESELRSGLAGSFLGNMTFRPHRRGVWQMKDVTQAVNEARARGHPIISVELYLNKQQGNLSAVSMPYLLLYANDRALADPNSVTASLQRYDPVSEGGEHIHRPNSSSKPKDRVRRESNLLDPILNNELPEVNYRPRGHRKDDLWDSNWYVAFKPKYKSERGENHKGVEKNRGGLDKDEPQGATQQMKKDESIKEIQTFPVTNKQKNKRKNEGKSGRKHKGNMKTQSPVLSFDEQTMQKARKRQSNEDHNRACSRRSLRVDFADIGWSEWVIAPKSFDAYYCGGMCGFPMPQVMRPSNHATIQSIVRAVGIIAGIPEPCCVPENMSPLAVLFQDESSNPVLKVYPNMSVQSCSCR